MLDIQPVCLGHIKVVQRRTSIRIVHIVADPVANVQTVSTKLPGQAICRTAPDILNERNAKGAFLTLAL